METAWCTQAVIRKRVDLITALVLCGSFLFWNSAGIQPIKNMKILLSERRIDYIMILAGIISYLQRLDLQWLFADGSVWIYWT